MGYTRVLPRDLFNEAKLLKCMGQLALFIHDYSGGRWKMRLMHDFPGRGFYVQQDRSSGDLYIDNLHLVVNGCIVKLASNYNCKSAYPLLFLEAECVFDDDGKFTKEFEDYLDSICQPKEPPCPAKL